MGKKSLKNPKVGLTSKGIVYAGSPVSGELMAVNLRSGRILWNVPLKTPFRTSGTRVGHYLLVPTSTGDVLTVEDRKGAIVRSVHLGGGFGPSSPVVVGGTVYLANIYGHVMAVPVSRFIPRSR